jgi:hypothetical protein
VYVARTPASRSHHVASCMLLRWLSWLGTVDKTCAPSHLQLVIIMCRIDGTWQEYVVVDEDVLVSLQWCHIFGTHS